MTLHELRFVLDRQRGIRLAHATLLRDMNTELAQTGHEDRWPGGSWRSNGSGDDATHVATALSFAAATSTYWRLSVAGLPVVLNRGRVAPHAKATRDMPRSRAAAGTAGRPLARLPTQSVSSRRPLLDRQSLGEAVTGGSLNICTLAACRLVTLLR